MPRNGRRRQARFRRGPALRAGAFGRTGGQTAASRDAPQASPCRQTAVLQRRTNLPCREAARRYASVSTGGKLRLETKRGAHQFGLHGCRGDMGAQKKSHGPQPVGFSGSTQHERPRLCRGVSAFGATEVPPAASEKSTNSTLHQPARASPHYASADEKSNRKIEDRKISTFSQAKLAPKWLIRSICKGRAKRPPGIEN
jgi:hypothetical protein